MSGWGFLPLHNASNSISKGYLSGFNKLWSRPPEDYTPALIKSESVITCNCKLPPGRHSGAWYITVPLSIRYVLVASAALVCRSCVLDSPKSVIRTCIGSVLKKLASSIADRVPYQRNADLTQGRFQAWCPCWQHLGVKDDFCYTMNEAPFC